MSPDVRFNMDFSHGKEVEGQFSCLKCLEISSQLINFPSLNRKYHVNMGCWILDGCVIFWAAHCMCDCVCVQNREVQQRDREVRSDEGWWLQKAEKLFVANREHLSSHTTPVLPGQFIWYLHSQNIVRPSLNKRCSPGRHKLVLFFSSAKPPTVYLPLVQINGSSTSVKL